MLVKIVNLTDNRFKNCRSTNFSNEYASFAGVKDEIAGAIPRKIAAAVESADDESLEAFRQALKKHQPKPGAETVEAPQDLSISIEAGKAESD